MKISVILFRPVFTQDVLGKMSQLRNFCASITTCFKLNVFERTSRTADCLHRPNEQSTLNKPSDNKIKDNFWIPVLTVRWPLTHVWQVITGSETSKIPKSLFEIQFRIVRILSQNQNAFKWFLTVIISGRNKPMIFTVNYS